MRGLLLLSGLILSLAAAAQQAVSSRVVDAETGEPLPYVSIYISAENGTLTNDEGDFTIMAEPEDTLRIRCVGFQTLRVRARELKSVVRLKPLAIDLKEMTVRPVADDKILDKVIARLQKDYKKAKKKRSRYFTRTVIVGKDSMNAEMMETFMMINSAVNLRDIAVLSGKLSTDQTDDWEQLDIKSTNLHHLMELAPMLKNSAFWNTSLFPLNDLKTSLKYYDISTAIVTGDEGERLYRIDMEYNGMEYNWKTPLMRGRGIMPALSGSLFVDAATYRLLRFDGSMENLFFNVNVQDMKEHIYDVENKVHLEFQHQNGYTEVANFSLHGITKNMTLRCLAFNINEMKLPKSMKDNKKSVGENYMQAIGDAGFDSILWAHSGIVKRTSHEEQLAFGTEAGIPLVKKRSFPVPDTVSLADPKLKELRDRLWKNAVKYPQEKVFVHMDNTSYFLGDTIWFAAYTQRTDHHIPSNISRVLYAELYDNDGYLVERKVLEMKNGWGCGNFVLNRPIQYGGFYELRAYTRWQLNWGQFEHKHNSWVTGKWFLSQELEDNYYRDYDKLYSRVFPVYDQPKEEGDYTRNMTQRRMFRYYRRDPNRRKLTLSLFPEGGNLVAGVENRVAFEASMNDGEELVGTLMTESQEVPAVNRGRGVFTVIPEKGMEREVTFITADGEKVSAKLPKPEEQGVAVQVKQTEDDIIIEANIVGLSPDSLALTIMHDGILEQFKALSALSPAPPRGEGVDTNPTQKVIQVTPSPRGGQGVGVPGIHQLTVFDTQGRVWADRLFFVSKLELTEPTLSISGIKDEYKPYEKIEMEVQTTPLPREGIGGGVGSSFISLAVRDGYQQDALFDNGNIMTEMLLSSELKGFISNPGWYFERNDEKHRQALDLLMMTQGWRRFDWRAMAVEDGWKPTQPREKAQILRCMIYNFNMNDLKREEKLLRRSRQENSVKDEPDQSNETPEEAFLREYDEEVPLTDEKTQRNRIEALQRTTAGRKRKEREYVVSSQMINPRTFMRFNLPTMRVSNRRFDMQLPRFYGDYVFRSMAKRYKKYEPEGVGNSGWEIIDKKNLANDLQVKRFQKRKDELQMEVDLNNNLILLDRPWPRFVKPYTYYQTHLSDSPDRDLMEPSLLADSIHQLREVPVRARFGGLRRFDDSQPAFKLSRPEAENLVTDAGIILGYPDRLGRTLFGTMGMDYPYVNVMRYSSSPVKSSQIINRYALTEEQRIIMQLDSVPQDSIYYPKYLKSVPDDNPAVLRMKNFSPESFVIYTDYSPRLEGDRRYWGSNLPEVYIVQYPYPDGRPETEKYNYRRLFLPGFARPAQFYSPDYSRQTPPEPTDYRRTLYWNPNLKLNENGRARVTLYNNSRTTKVSVEAEGQTAEGGLLWSK